jgi:hypothetical protein
MMKDMRTIHKYSISEPVLMPEGYRILKAAMQGDKPTIWVELDKDRERVYFLQFVVYGTGVDIPDNPGIYLDTLFEGALVWHVYYVIAEC